VCAHFFFFRILWISPIMPLTFASEIHTVLASPSRPGNPGSPFYAPTGMGVALLELLEGDGVLATNMSRCFGGGEICYDCHTGPCLGDSTKKGATCIIQNCVDIIVFIHIYHIQQVFFLAWFWWL
jgi:hypothetical protein